MKKGLFLTAFILIMGITVLSAANIEGKWKGSVEGPDGAAMELTYTFKIDGEKLTGNVSFEMGEMEISEGKITGDEFEFVLAMEQMVIKNKGKVDGDEIKLSSSSDFGDNEIILKRIKE